MVVSGDRGTQRWTVLENPIEMDDLGVPLFEESPQMEHEILPFLALNSLN